MAKVLKKDYRAEVKAMKDLVKLIEIIAEQGTGYTDRDRTMRACEALKTRADRLTNLMKVIIIEEQKGAN
jgi:hypothetical protein